MNKMLVPVLSAIFLLSHYVFAEFPGRVLEADLHPTLSPTGEWKVIRSISSRDSVDLMVLFRKSNAALKQLEERFWAVSDPAHADYGKFLTGVDVKNIVQVPQSSIDSVVHWFKTESPSCSTNVGPDGDSLRVQMPAADASRMFKTELKVYGHASVEQALPIIRTPSPYSIPQELAGIIEMVGNLRHFPPVWTLQYDDVAEGRKTVAEKGEDSSDDWPMDCGKCSKGLFGNRVTPAVLTQAYSLGEAPNGTAKGSIAVAEFTQVYWDQEDLNLFAKDCNIKNFTLDMHGDNEPKQCFVSIIIRPNLCKEALLDIETIKGISGTIPLSNYYTKQYSILDWTETLLALEQADLPLVQSVSYGNDESQQSSTSYMLSVNVQLQKLGVRGVSVLFASGDGGVFGRRGSSKRFHPGFPATSPYATAVGGTDFAVKNTIGEETAWAGSGGGFSDTFGIPSYQADAVANYKKTAASQLPDASKWNQTGRGFPDVAALGGNKNQYCIALANSPTGAYGTSAATPMFASVVAKLNEIRLSKGDSPMGFLNPFIYKNAHLFNDVTTGNNGGRPGEKWGFPATKGWDATTGVGTPNFEKLAQAV